MTFTKKWIVPTVLLLAVAGAAVVITVYFQALQKRKWTDRQYDIIAIAQTSSGTESLQTSYLAELLDLSIDHPTNLFLFDLQGATQKLLACPLIKKARIKKIKPATIHVEYALRQPIAFFGELSNTAIDAEGVLIPFKPFFTPKKLPVIYAGEGDRKLRWGEVIKGPRMTLAIDISRHLISSNFSDFFMSVKIDVSKACALSFGQKEIVVTLENNAGSYRAPERNVAISQVHILRLTPHRYHQELANYLALRSHIIKSRSENTILIDLRIPQLGFLHPCPPLL